MKKDLLGDPIRVTEVLYPYSGLQYINESVLANAARRGTRVHNACEAIINGLGRWDVDEEIGGYIKSFDQWWNLGHKVLAIEKRFTDEDLNLTGQVDLILDTSEGVVVLDLKTPLRPSKTWPLQGSAYAYLARKSGYDVKGIQFLQLDKTGKAPTLHHYEDDFVTFKKCFDIYKIFFQKKKPNDFAERHDKAAE